MIVISIHITTNVKKGKMTNIVANHVYKYKYTTTTITITVTMIMIIQKNFHVILQSLDGLQKN